ncbi:PDZ domain-containing protein [Salinivibrio kushneri]|uniref:PDZ domain-containing protein n=1 Tax=Salinivibrio kushneri TaxID=1908198 RepID=UPI0009898244|nr:PDZ domain-containing protein [Salinivibrio kushneri]OOE71702.1 hypothetical protein BZG19_01970 [Salinivibrio kushneri]
MKGKVMVAALACLFLAGCAANPFNKYYESYGTSHVPNPQKLKEGEEPRVIGVSFDSLAEQTRKIKSQEYFIIGNSSFSGGPQTRDKVIKTAKKHGAQVVIVAQKYSHTDQNNTPLVLPTSQTTISSGTISGDVNGSIFGSSTTTGMTAIPMSTSTRVYDYYAVYLIKGRIPKGNLGVTFTGVPTEVRKEVGRNTGAYIVNIIEGRPAFNANLLIGDIITKVGGTEIKQAYELPDIVKNLPRSQKTVTLTILRNGETLTKELERL